MSASLNLINHFPQRLRIQSSMTTTLGPGQIISSNKANPRAHLEVSIAKNAKYCTGQGPKGKIQFDGSLSVLDLFSSNPYEYDCKQIHGHFVKMDASDCSGSIANRLVIMYLKREESMDSARRLFEEMTDRTLQLYTYLIRSYCRLEQWGELFSIFGLLILDGVLLDKFLVPTVVKACSAMKLLRIGKMVHGSVLRRELASDVFVGNALINMYANCGDLRYSRTVFYAMEERDVVSWTTLVSAYMDGGLVDESVEAFKSMQVNGIRPDLVSWTTLVSGYAQNGEIDMAIQSLERMQEKGLKPNAASWNGIISGCVQNGYFDDASDLFIKMFHFPENPTVVTIVSILPAYAGLKNLKFGRVIHGYALKQGLCGNVRVKGSLINMYSKCGRIDYAEKVFLEVENKSIATWNEMIAAYVNEGKMETALLTLRSMQKRGIKTDEITYNTLLAGNARSRRKDEAYALLSEMTNRNLVPDIITYNNLISGFQQSGLTKEALNLFRVMQSPSSNYFTIEKGNASIRIQPNPVSATGALAACADLNLLCQGKEIHGYVLKNGFDSNIFASSTLVDMYIKCHDMTSATKVFWNIKHRNVVTWNSLIMGYINNKQPKQSLKLFVAMLYEGVEPSSFTFLILLPAYGDLGAFNLGRELHGYLVKNWPSELNRTLADALADMYTKCGCITEAGLVWGSFD